MKYSWEYKLQCVENYRTGKEIIYPSGISRARFRNKITVWVRLYDLHGIDGLKHRQFNRVWSKEERFELVARVMAGESCMSVAMEAGISDGQLYQWVRKYKLEGYDGLELRKQGRPCKEPKPMKKEIEDNTSEYTNEELELMHEKANVEGSNFKFIVKDKNILEIFHKYVGSTQNEVIELDIRDNLVYRIKIDPVYLQDSKHAIIGSIINIEDITELVKLENMRRDFVANVSHELKTPLTSITGFVETLKINDDIDKDTRNHFLDIIEKESNRLKGLIEDILLLSSIENGQDLSYEQVKLFDVFKEVYEITQYIASSKNITVSYNFEDKDVHILADRDNVKKIFLNLVDNGIKYTPENGRIEVLQHYDENKQNIILEFKDNGIGIPKESLNRIFERFYRVDKARSRDIGGTGLGLAITKHMVKSLGGTIEVESILGVGSDFIVTIPLDTK